MSIELVSLNALPPYAQEAREMDAISNDPQVQEYLEKLNEKIIRIYKNFQNQYTVQTSHHTIQVNVIYTHDEKLCQPKNFRLEVFSPQFEHLIQRVLKC